MNADQKYAALIADVLAQPVVGTRNSFGPRAAVRTVEFDSVPLVTTRKTAWRNALREMEWFLSGSNNINDLHPDVRKWWQPWACPTTGQVKNNYGEQFRSSSAVLVGVGVDYFDQIEWLIGAVRDHPFSRRNCVTTWNTGEMQAPETPITNCHGSWVQVFGNATTESPSGVSIDLWMVQRSCDLILGVPHNWVQYWAVLLWLAHRTGHAAGKFVWTGGDVHVYAEHEVVALAVVDNSCSADEFIWPSMAYAPSGDDFRADDFAITNVPPAAVTAPARMVV